VGPDFGFALRVYQISELCSHSPGDCRSLAAVLETSEIGTIAPGEWSAYALRSRQSGIMRNVAEALRFRIHLSVAGKLAQIPAGRNYRVGLGYPPGAPHPLCAAALLD